MIISAFSNKNSKNSYLKSKIFFDLKQKKDKILDAFRDSIVYLGSEQSISKDDLLLVHTKKYVEQLFSSQIDSIITEVFEFEKYHNKSAELEVAEKIRDGLLQEAYVVFLTMKYAVHEQKDYFYVGGGAHHAESDWGYGFCLIADVAIALKKLQHEKMIKTAWIIDVDAHMGNGNSEIFANCEDVTTLSIHMSNSWPFGTLENIVGSDYDIPIAETEQHLYLEKLKQGLDDLICHKEKPDLVIVLQGADAYEKDSLKSSDKLKLSLDQMGERDRMVFNRMTKLNVPQIYLMAGGYGEYAHEPYVHFLNFVSIS